MQRVCFVLQVKPQKLEEYKERHRSVWPEMLAGRGSVMLMFDAEPLGGTKTDWAWLKTGVPPLEV